MNNEIKKYDLFIIGGGPGGYTAAAAAASHGLATGLAEDRQLGGTCLIRGCIPTKTLMHTSEHLRQMRGGVPGITGAGALGCDMEALQARREAVSNQLSGNIADLMKKRKVDVFEGKALIREPHRITVRGNDGGVTEIEAEKILIATGSDPSLPPVPGAELPGVMTSDDLIRQQEIPGRLVIIGGGVIGIELATVFNGLGSEVTIIEGMSRLLGPLDREFSQSIRMIMKKRGVNVFTSSMLRSITRSAAGSLSCEFAETVKGSEEIHTAEADVVLMAAGRKPDTAGLLADGFSLETEKGYIVTDENMMTSCQDIYAIGDVTGGIQLAHAAQAQAENFVALICGVKPPAAVQCIPACVYTDPEIAYCGMTLEEAKAAGFSAVSKKYPMLANGRSVLSQQERGFIKYVYDQDTEKILGAQMMCANAVDMISEFAVAVVNGLTKSEMAAVVRPHPSFSEGITEVLKL